MMAFIVSIMIGELFSGWFKSRLLSGLGVSTVIFVLAWILLSSIGLALWFAFIIFFFHMFMGGGGGRGSGRHGIYYGMGGYGSSGGGFGGGGFSGGGGGFGGGGASGGW